MNESWSFSFDIQTIYVLSLSSLTESFLCSFQMSAGHCIYNGVNKYMKSWQFKLFKFKKSLLGSIANWHDWRIEELEQDQREVNTIFFRPNKKND